MTEAEVNGEQVNYPEPCLSASFDVRVAIVTKN